VHLPELSLRTGSFSSLRREARVRVGFGERKVTEHETQLTSKIFLRFLHYRVRHAAVRALVVAVLDQRDRRIVGTRGVEDAEWLAEAADKSVVISH